jgi:hypothetical protein
VTLTDDFCKSNELPKEERLACYQVSADLLEMLKDLDLKGYLRSKLRSTKGEQRENFMHVLLNVRKVTNAFNMWFDNYVDKAKPDSKQRLKKIIEIGELTEEDAVYLLYSEMVFVFQQTIEEFRSTLLSILKLPIQIEKNGKKKTAIHRKTTLNPLLGSLEKLKIAKADSLSKLIDIDLRNGLSHGLFWFSMKDTECPEAHLHYSKDIDFRKICCVSISELYVKTRKQSLYTNCLLNVIGDWFENTI